jgi:hypothetical protein
VVSYNRTKVRILIQKISVFTLGLVLLYSFFTAILYGYSGKHWQGIISLKQRLLLNSAILISTLIVIYLFISDKKKFISGIVNSIRIKQILILAFLLRICWVLFSGIIQTSDFALYDQTAIEILNGANILNYISNSRNVGTSVFISAHYWLFGTYQAIPLFSIAILSMVQIILINKILNKIVGRYYSKFATLIIAIFPEHILLNNLLGSDVIFSTLCCLGIYLTFKFFNSPNKNIFYMLLVGLTYGLSHWIRSTALIFLISNLLFIFVTEKLTKNSFYYSSPLILGFFIVISPIIYHNYSIKKKIDIKPIHGQFGKSLLIGTFYEGDGRISGWKKKENHKYLRNQVMKYKLNKLDSNYFKDDIYTKIAIQRMTHSPFKFLKLVCKYKLTNLWGITSGLGFSLETSILKKWINLIWGLSEIFHKIVLLLSGFIMLVLWKRHVIINDVRVILVWAALGTTILHTFLESHPRYHHMFIPLLVMYLPEMKKIDLKQIKLFNT